MRESDPTTPMILRIPSPLSYSLSAVTLVTQFSISRLTRFERTLSLWTGPISLSIYLTDSSDISTLESYLLSSPSLLSSYRSIALTIIKPSYEGTEAALVERLRYPINRLRNLALDIAPTAHVLVTDADFVPSPDMHSILETRAVPLISHPAASGRTRSPTLRRTAVVISAFVLSPPSNTTIPYPSTPSELSTLLSSHPPLATLTDPNAGHGPSLPSLLLSPSSSPSFDICYEPQWEPYYVLHTPSHPLYDERFTDQGGDKQSHALLLNALGYSFKALRDVWFMHPPKDALSTKEDEWPSSRLVDPELEVEDHTLANVNEEKKHFSVAQRDQRRWRYFEDYVPEVRRGFGWNFRFPGGCAAGVVGVRSFGRARAGVVFGM
ncbi:hypothetical protein RQP46_003770 [Phenoliferia psychrophenolica]